MKELYMIIKCKDLSLETKTEKGSEQWRYLACSNARVVRLKNTIAMDGLFSFFLIKSMY